MPLSEIIMHFAERTHGQHDEPRLVRKFGDIRHDLDHLVQLGVLTMNMHGGIPHYFLRKHSRFGMRRSTKAA